MIYDPQSRWPFSLTPGSEPLFWRIFFLLLIAALLADGPVTIAVSGIRDGVKPIFEIITIPGDSVWTLVPALAVAIIGFVFGRFVLSNHQKQRALTAASVGLFIFASVGLTGLLAKLLKMAVGRARAFQYEALGPLHFEPFSGHGFESFPSGDTTTVFALAITIGFFLPRYVNWALLAAALVGLARIMLGMHYPSDVFGGICLGLFGAHAVRAFCLSKGWIFVEDGQGKVVPKLNWPDPA